MRAIGVASAALLGATAALALAQVPRATAAPTAPSEGEARDSGHEQARFRAAVAPRAVVAGGRVMLVATGCAGDTTVSSGVFDAVTLRAHQPPVMAGVGAHARPGAAYDVLFACADGATRTVRLIIAGHQNGAAVPLLHGARAGLGGSLGSFDLQEIGVGVALLAGALALAYRRSRRPGADEAPREPASPAASAITAPASGAPASSESGRTAGGAVP